MITKPKGTYDLINKDAQMYKYIEGTIEEFMSVYNYDFIRTPVFESTELFHRSVGDETDIVSKETYDFKDRGDRNITLRPEGTAGIVRSYIENKLYGNKNDAVKLWYLETMYRYERPGAGRNREFTQFGIETFGSNEVMIDAEVISIGYNLLNVLGLSDIVVSINSLGDKESRERYTKALVEYLKPYESDLCSDCQRRIKTNPLRVLDCKVDADKDYFAKIPKISDYLSEESTNRFSSLLNLLRLLDIDYEIDDKLVRGLDYYSENVWEYKNASGTTLGGGGRYNSLVETLGGPSTPGIGFALGLDRIIIDLEKELDASKFTKKIDVYIMCLSEEEKLKATMIAQDLRLNGIITEVNNNNLSLKSMFKVADSLNASFLLILKNEDLQKGLITIKDNVTKEEIKIDESELVDYLLGNI